MKAMEEKGIGRPSTYASTVGTIQDRGYVNTRGNALIPTWLAFAVTRLLEEHFSELVDYDFTASMEEDLDRIAGGDEQRAAWLQRFYFGDGLAERASTARPAAAEHRSLRPGPQAPRRRPRRDRRPRDLDHPDRRGHRRAGRPLRPLRRGDRPAGVDLSTGEMTDDAGAPRRAAPPSTTTSPPTR